MNSSPLIKGFNNPFVGLRAFDTNESILFFGRDQQIAELLERLRRFRFLAVVGNSGCGKSSLIRAGLIPKLKCGALTSQYDGWQTAVMCPGNDPLYYLAEAIIKSEPATKKFSHDEVRAAAQHLKSETIHKGVAAIYSAIEQINSDAGEPANFLLLVDQFEELFDDEVKKDIDCAIKTAEKIEDEQIRFVNILLHLAEQVQLPIFVVMTVRSDFLGHCNQFFGLPEAINQGQYLVPRLNREQRREAIEKPVKLFDAKLSNGSLNRVLIDSDTAQDELPVMQHAMMRTWQEWEKPEKKTDEIKITHYEDAGTIAGALSKHAGEIYANLVMPASKEPLTRQEIAKIIFKSLTKVDERGRHVRRPQQLQALTDLCNSFIHDSHEDLRYVIDAFRCGGNAFLLPYKGNLNPDTYITISHESLMRNWEILKEWIKEEESNGKLYQLLNERRELNIKDPNEFVRGVVLKELITWRDKEIHNIAWASRYHEIPKNNTDRNVHANLYKSNLEFLEKSKSKFDKEKQDEKERLKKDAEREQKDSARKRGLFILATAAVICLCCTAWALTERKEALAQSKKAIAKSYQALVQRKEALAQKGIADSLRIKAEQSAAYAGRQKVLADDLRIKAEVAANEATKLRQQAEDKKNEALQLKDQIVNQKVELEKSLELNNLATEGFYSTKTLDRDTRSIIVNALFRNNPPAERPRQFKYVDSSLLHQVNAAILVKEKFLVDPVVGLRMAKVLSLNNKSTVVDAILFDIFKKNIFYEQEVHPSAYGFSRRSSNASLLTFSKDHSRFAFVNLDRIVTGTYSNDRLAIDTNSVILYSDKYFYNSVPQPATAALSFSGDDKILFYNGKNKVMKWSINGKADAVINISDLSNSPRLAEFSPDGGLLALSFADGTIKILDINSKSIIAFEKNIPVRKLKFSADSKKLILFLSNAVKVWESTSKLFVPKFDSLTERVTTASFSPDANYILMNSPSGVSIFDLKGNKLARTSFSTVKNEDQPPLRNIDDLVISSDWKKLLITRGQEMFIISKTNGDSIISLKRDYDYKIARDVQIRNMAIMTKKLPDVAFLSRDEAVSLTAEGNISLWNTDKRFPNLTKAFSAVTQVTQPTLEENLEEFDFNKVSSLSGVGRLRTGAELYYNNYQNLSKEEIQYLKHQYYKLLSLDTGYLKFDDRKKIIGINNEMYRRTRDQKDHTVPEESLRENKDILENLLKANAEDTVLKLILSENYWSLSYFQLLIKKFDSAIAFAKRGLELNPKNDGINSNLALGYLLSRHFREADSIYNKYKGKSYSSRAHRPFNDAFLGDIKDLEEEGIISPSDDVLQKQVSAIKERLQN